jgi:hypothetical protein
LNLLIFGNRFFFLSEIYEKYQNQLAITIYPSEWFEIIDGCRLNLNNYDQVLFPDQYGEHIFDKRTKITEFISKLEVKKFINFKNKVLKSVK